MKKNKIKILICTILVCFIFWLTACGNKCKNHEYDNNCDAICNLCGEERDVQAHQWNAANCTLPETCKDCGLTKGEAVGHNLEYYEGYGASCVEDGIINHWYCKTCSAKFLDKEGKSMLTDDELYFSTDAHSLIHHELKESTCTEEGKKEYYYCYICESYFTDEDATHITTDEELKILSTGHSLTHHELKEATCTEEGKKEYYDCYICESYFIDEDATQIIEYEDVIIPKKEHVDENEDYICDHNCGEMLLKQEKLQQIIENTMSSNKVIVKEYYIPGARNISYYFDENLLYINDDYSGEKYYNTEDDVTYLFTKLEEWTKEITTDIVKYNVSYLFENKHNITIASELSVYNCDYGFFEGKTMFEYTNSLGTLVKVKLNNDETLLGGFYICDEYNNIIYMYEMIYGENNEILSSFETINNCLDDKHKLGGKGINNNDGTHTAICDFCDYEETDDCIYNDLGLCDVCSTYQSPILTEGKYDIDNNSETTDKVYEISNVGNLYSFMKIVEANENNSSLNVILTNNIVVNKNLISSINSDSLEENNLLMWNTVQNNYIGIFDGNGYTISGLYANEINTYDSICGGFLGFLDSDGIIKNLGIIDSYFSYECVGASYVGGIAGISFGKITNCFFDGIIESIGDFDATAGGIVGNYRSEKAIENCYNLGIITASHFAGGLVGGLDLEMKNCYNYNPNIVSGEDGGIGGLTGFIYDTASFYNSYYIDSIENYTSDPSTEIVVENVRSIAISEFASSDFATLLNGDQEDTPWEFIEGNKYPTLKIFNKDN